MSDRFSRREFLEKSAMAGLAGAALGARPAAGAMPTRMLGKTGARISILALGCGSRLEMYRTEEAAVEAINLALDSGISYLDTAYGYGEGRSESWVGQVAKTRRKEFFLEPCYSTHPTGIRQKSIIFHEALHGFFGLDDQTIQTAYHNLDTSVQVDPINTGNISDYIAHHVFGWPSNLSAITEYCGI